LFRLVNLLVRQLSFVSCSCQIACSDATSVESRNVVKNDLVWCGVWCILSDQFSSQLFVYQR
jgi:hypothetical protein